MAKEKLKTVDEYIASKEVEIQEYLSELRNIILDIIPQAKESIAWNMPSYKLGKYVVHFEAYKDHVNVYYGSEVVNLFKDTNPDYKFTGRGISLYFNKELPHELIKDMTLESLRMIEEKE